MSRKIKIFFRFLCEIGPIGFLVMAFAFIHSGAAAQDSIEVESDIGVEQMKSSGQVDKSRLKPRADYGGKPQTTATPLATGKTEKEKEQAAKWEARKRANMSGLDVPKKVSQTDSLNAGQRPDTNLEDAKTEPPKDVITDHEIVEISESLRKLIEENNKLKNEIGDLKEQVKTVRGQQKLESNRFNEVALERDALRKQNKNIISLGSETDKKLKELESQLTQKEEDYNLRIVQLQTELAKKLQSSAGQEPDLLNRNPSATASGNGMNRSVTVDVVSSPNAEEVKKRREKVLSGLSAISDERKSLVRDEARLHYNMGNTYFNQGAYHKAVHEYARALELTPEDASAHYNLAFVSGEFLNDFKMALDHYKKYLFFNPRAEDAEMVRQKIIEAEISVKGDVHFKTQINEELRKKKNEVNEILAN